MTSIAVAQLDRLYNDACGKTFERLPYLSARLRFTLISSSVRLVKSANAWYALLSAGNMLPDKFKLLMRLQSHQSLQLHLGKLNSSSALAAHSAQEPHPEFKGLSSFHVW